MIYFFKALFLTVLFNELKIWWYSKLILYFSCIKVRICQYLKRTNLFLKLKSYFSNDNFRDRLYFEAVAVNFKTLRRCLRRRRKNGNKFWFYPKEKSQVTVSSRPKITLFLGALSLFSFSKAKARPVPWNSLQVNKSKLVRTVSESMGRSSIVILSMNFNGWNSMSPTFWNDRGGAPTKLLIKTDRLRTSFSIMKWLLIHLNFNGCCYITKVDVRQSQFYLWMFLHHTSETAILPWIPWSLLLDINAI